MTKTKKLINRSVIKCFRDYLKIHPAWGNLRKLITEYPVNTFRFQSILDHCQHTGDEPAWRLAIELYHFSEEQWNEFIDIFGSTITSPLI